MLPKLPERRHWFAAAWLALAVGLPYANALANGFVWDDVALIQQDDRIRSLDHLGEIFSQDFFEHANEQVKYGYYRPVITVSYMFDYALWGVDPTGYHLTNLVLHWLCALGVYAFALVVVGVGPAAALAAAVIFAVHPVHTESVSWISGRTDVLATALVLAAWLFAARAERASSVGARRALVVTSSVVFLLAVLAKETALILPLLVFVFDLGRLPWRRALVRSIPHGLVVAIYAVLRFGVVRVDATPFTDRPLLTHLATASKALWRYLGELFWPLPLQAYLQHPWLDMGSATAWLFLASACVPLAWLYACWRLRWLTPFRLVAGFGLALLPHAGLWRVSGPSDMGLVMAERFLYLPSVFFCIAIGALAFAWPRARSVAPLALAGVVIGSASAVAKRNPDWRDDGTLMHATLPHAPDASLLHLRLGAYQSLRGDHAAAVKSLHTALDLHRRETGSESPPLVLDLAVAMRRAGDSSGALALLEPLVALGYDPPAVLYNLGETLRLLRRPDEARAALESCVRADASFVGAHLSLSRLEAEGGRLDYALAHYEQALALSHDDVGLLLWGGDLRRMRGEVDAAEQAYRRALAIDPAFAHAEAALGAVAAERGDQARARKHFDRALELEPELHEARVALAVLHARAGELDEAATELDAVLDRAPGNVEALVTRALVFWHQGKLAEARATAAQAFRRQPGNPRASQILAALARPGSVPPLPAESAP